ncbi:lipoyl(octanoyl) transferase LipB [Candidatus Methylopumilus planktonicus]|uniref:lipoyl(octanoyl) transferase LipB n=1 Tax=Candidatus Methylopumilus planktonicus TaxID=1581557 RepID=UPI001124857D|nr:lipoyl(octanoyl) transferase LipB [Candidatus Methylopumilus planktonicus]QDD02178.1 lipoyl(octanoyl) transferase LipB [Candidatus Methylopumilus planktonicus]
MSIDVKYLGITPYESTWNKMKVFTSERVASTQDEIWITEHEAIYTVGLNRKDFNKPLRTDIAVLPVDRGGKITYHGRGQLIIYPLIDLERYQLTIRTFVTLIEKSIVSFLSRRDIKASAKIEAPGVYIENKKIASLGLRIKNHASYHGLSMNIDMDLLPFEAIDPCGFKNLQMTQLKTFTNDVSVEAIGFEIANDIKHQLLNLK